MVEILIQFIVIVALFHFIYEGIILPSIRLSFRNKLFCLRDELRAIYINEKDTLDHDVFNLIHDSLTNFINRIHTLTISTRSSFNGKYVSDEEFRKKIDSRVSMVEDYDHQELKRILKEANNVLEYAFIANAGAWFIYLVPIALVVGSIKAISNTAKEIFVIPDYDAEKLMPVTT